MSSEVPFSLKDGIYKGITKGVRLQIVTRGGGGGGGGKPGFPALQGVKCLHILLKRETCHEDIRMRRGLTALTMTLRLLNVQ